MKKIFHIISNKEWGGGEQYVYDLSKRQQADNIDVHIISKPIESIINKFNEIGIQPLQMDLGGAIDLKSAWQIAKIINTSGPCTIHAHNFKDAFTACYARKLSSNKEVRVVMCRHLTRPGKNSLLYRWLYGQLDALCFDSELSKNAFLSTNPNIDQTKLSIVHTSIVAHQDIKPIDIRSELHIPTDTVLAMYHGRIDPEKGLDTLIEAAGRIKDQNFQLVLIGRGSDEYTKHLNQLISEQGLNQQVKLIGFRHPVLPYVASADFGILVSTVCEGCPLSPQEYMSQGKPVLVTNNGGQREYVTDGRNGILVPPCDVIQISAALERFITDKEMRQQMGQQAKADYDKNLNYEHFYSQIKKLYQS